LVGAAWAVVADRADAALVGAVLVPQAFYAEVCTPLSAALVLALGVDAGVFAAGRLALIRGTQNTFYHQVRVLDVAVRVCTGTRPYNGVVR